MNKLYTFLKISVFLFLFLTVHIADAEAATLRLNPGTGVYTVGNIFTVSVLINTDNKSINAADGQVSFNPRELQVVSVTRGGSIFNLWTEEPAYSNSAGTVSFGGGSPSGYKGASGNIVTITFRALGAGTPKVNFKSGSILAADGMGTNILTGMSGGTYTISAQTNNPEPEYIAPANTPKAPVVTSATHPDPEKWYKETTAKLSWTLPSDVTAVRMLLDDSKNTIPTNVYDERITSKEIVDLEESISYFHIQFKNTDGWGKVTHYALNVDTKVPEEFTIQNGEATGEEKGTLLTFNFKDTSPVREYRIQLDGAEPVTFTDEKLSKTYLLGVLTPGYHTVVVEAFDSAGNSSIASHSFSIDAFEKPVFTDYPTRINTEVIPALKGTTRPDAQVTVEVRRATDNLLIEQGGDTVTSNADGVFVFIPDSTLEVGVYEITAVAVDDSGKTSERSDAIRIIVEVPAFIAAGSMVVSVLSVLVPLIALVLLALFGVWYLWFRFNRWRRRIQKETAEVENSLTFEFNRIVKNMDKKVSELLTSRKGKLTKAEEALIEQIQADLQEAQSKIKAEVEDIEDIIT